MWQLLTLLFRKSEDENKSQICDFSRYFSRKGKKFSRKCDCIGRNFKPCSEIRRGSAPYEVCLQENDLCMPGMVITVLTFESLYTDMKCSVKRRLGKMSLKYRSYRCRFLLPSLHSNQFLTRGQY